MDSGDDCVDSILGERVNVIRMSKKLRVLFVVAEASPFVQVGGLGDVAGFLPPALKSLPQAPDVRVVLPFHRDIDKEKYALSPVAAFPISHATGPIQVEIWETEVDDVTYYLVSSDPITTAEEVYSDDNYRDGIKFILFSLASLELAKSIDWRPDIFHGHDWHAATAIYAMKVNQEASGFYAHTSTLLTVHNLPYLGNGAGDALKSFGLPRARGRSLPRWARRLPLPLGLLTADKINTVSPGYTEEILTPSFSAGLHKFLRTRQEDISGILNGIDVDQWNPATDQAIAENYSRKTLGSRKKNKEQLQRELVFTLGHDVPMFAFIGRMSRQKGVDLILKALPRITDVPWQMVILGAGDESYENKVLRLAEKHPDRIRTIIRYDSELARRLYAGADAVVIPSLYEPCGLVQMIAMRYGCVPIGRAVGGLRDAIRAYGESSESTGFLFQAANPRIFADTLRQTMVVYQDQEQWRGLQRRGMSQDFSWTRSAREYYELYESISMASELNTS
jgi:starch synthase